MPVHSFMGLIFVIVACPRNLVSNKVFVFTVSRNAYWLDWMVVQSVTVKITNYPSINALLPVSHDSPVQRASQMQLSGEVHFPLSHPLWQIAKVMSPFKT